jgi:transcriptional regulator with XRE-family HTH domain
MNNPSWRAEDGQLLRSLREEAGIDALVFARNNTVSLAQLKELESGGNNSFYNPAIKRNTGVKLLKKLGHDLDIPAQFKLDLAATKMNGKEQRPALSTVVEKAIVSQAKVPSDSQRRRWLQQTFFGL